MYLMETGEKLQEGELRYYPSCMLNGKFKGVVQGSDKGSKARSGVVELGRIAEVDPRDVEVEENEGLDVLFGSGNDESSESVGNKDESLGGRASSEGMEGDTNPERVESSSVQESESSELEEPQLSLIDIKEGSSTDELRKETLSDSSLEVIRKLADKKTNGYLWNKGLVVRQRLDDLGRVKGTKFLLVGSYCHLIY